MISNALRKLTSARARLILDHPFWGALALSLPLVEDETCETAWVDGRVFGYNPAFIESLDMDETKALIAHEVSHCAQGHPWRRDARDSKLWNEATDKAINHDLKEAGFKLPADGLYATGDEIGKSAEWIYAKQQQKPKGQQGGQKPKPGQGPGQGQGQQQGQGSGQPDPNAKPQPNKLGEVRDAPKTPDAQGKPAPTEQDWKQKVQQAAAVAKGCGNMPAGGKRIVEQALKPRIDLHSLLLRFFQERTSADFNWQRPNPRYLSQGFYLPGLQSNELGEVAVLVDTSGSMGSLELQKAKGILEQVLDEVCPSGLTVYFVDTKIHGIQRMERGEPLVFEPKGGGGTDFSTAFSAMENADNPPVCIIGVSDLCATFPTEIPSTPVLWITDNERREAPFGETVVAQM